MVSIWHVSSKAPIFKDWNPVQLCLETELWISDWIIEFLTFYCPFSY